MAPPPSELLKRYKKQVLFRYASNESPIYICIRFAFCSNIDAGLRLWHCGPLSLRGVLVQLDTLVPDCVPRAW